MGLFGIGNGRKDVIWREAEDSRAKVNIAILESFSPQQIREIRLKTGLSRLRFAEYMGVSVKTVEAWEIGRNHPEGPACRLLTLTRDEPNFPCRFGIIIK